MKKLNVKKLFIKKLVMLTTLLSLFAAMLLGAPPVSAQADPVSYGFVREPATGSLWMTLPSIFGASGIVAEWREDGSFLATNGPFNRYAIPQNQGLATFQNAAILDGRFGILGDSRTVYRRLLDGSFAAEPVFAPEGPLACLAKAPGVLCHLIGANQDTRGIESAYIFTGNDSFSHQYREHGQYRAANALESLFDGDQSTLLRQITWSKDGSAAFGFDSFLTANARYFTYTRDGGLGHSLDLGMSDVSYIDRTLVQEYGGADYLFLHALVYTSGYNDRVALFRMDNALTADAKLSLLWQSSPTVGVSGMIGFEESRFYYRTDLEIWALVMPEARPVKVATCTAPAVSVTSAPGTVWVGCGPQLLQLENGNITTTLEAPAAIRYGTIVSAPNEPVDAALGLADGSLTRLRPGSPASSTRLSPLPGRPALSQIWAEDDAVCGVQNSGEVVCRRGGTWKPVTSPLGKVQAVVKVGEVWWATGLVNKQRQVFNRHPGGSWQLVQSWDGDNGPATLVHVGLTGIGVDLGTAQLQVFDGHSFAPAYNHHRAAVPSLPAVSSDGVLYDVCESNNDQITAIKLCAVTQDGVTSYVNGGPQGSDYSDTPLFTPLKRGVLVQYGTTNFVIRGITAIDLSHLYGEFLPRKGQDIQVLLTALGDGTIALNKTISGSDDGAQPANYLYDGLTLQPQAVVALNHSLESRQTASAGFAVSAGATPVVSGPLTLTQAQVWPGTDHIWYARSSSNSPYADAVSTGTDVFLAVAGNADVAPDYVNDAVMTANAVILATDDGLWSCPVDGLVAVQAKTQDLPRSRGCSRIIVQPFVRRILAFANSYLIQQGQRIVLTASPLTEASKLTTLSSPVPADHLAFDGEAVAWSEGDQLVTYNAASESLRIALPVDLGDLHAVAPHWACGQGGLFYRDAASWQRSSLNDPCLGMVAHGSEVVAVTATHVMACKNLLCDQGTALPQTYDPDGIIGNLSTDPKTLEAGVVLGTNLYRFDAAHQMLTDITPTYARGSLLLSRSSQLSAGILSLQGGGAVILPRADGAAPLHVRLE